MFLLCFNSSSNILYDGTQQSATQKETVIHRFFKKAVRDSLGSKSRFSEMGQREIGKNRKF